jgi:hypothetical protein
MQANFTKPLDSRGFEGYLEGLLFQIREVLGTKAGEYVVNDDRFHNFHQGLRQFPDKFKTREDVMEAFQIKHLISIQDILQKLRNGELPTEVLVKEKFGDAINYYILMLISILDRIDYEKSTYTPIDDLPF